MTHQTVVLLVLCWLVFRSLSRIGQSSLITLSSCICFSLIWYFNAGFNILEKSNLQMSPFQFISLSLRKLCMYTIWPPIQPMTLVASSHVNFIIIKYLIAFSSSRSPILYTTALLLADNCYRNGTTVPLLLTGTVLTLLLFANTLSRAIRAPHGSGSLFLPTNQHHRYTTLGSSHMK